MPKPFLPCDASRVDTIQRGVLPIVLVVASLMSACGGGGTADGATGPAVSSSGTATDITTKTATLDGAAPLIIGHRGLPGLYPEQTSIAYQNAADAGADSLEVDLHLSKDCVVVARHNPWLSDNTNIAQVAAADPAVMARKRTVPGRLVDVGYDAAKVGGPAQYLTDLTNPTDPKSVLKSLVVDGEDHTGDWSITDFTLPEIKQWLRGTTYDAATERPTIDNGRYPVLTFQEVIDIANIKSTSLGRPVSVYPESKNPYWNNQQAIANGCDIAGTGHPFEDALLKVIVDNRMNSREASVFVQSFDPASLKYLRSAGLKSKVVQLIDGNAVDYRTGAMIYQSDDAYNFVSGRPYSWTLGGDSRYFGELLTPDGLKEIKTYADGVGPWKPMVMAWTISPFPATRADGKPFTGSLADVNQVTPTGLIADAHRAGLFVHSYTFRNETRYLPGFYRGDPQAELLQFFAAGIDGVFTDFTGTGVAARAAYLATIGQ